MGQALGAHPAGRRSRLPHPVDGRERPRDRPRPRPGGDGAPRRGAGDEGRRGGGRRGARPGQDRRDRAPPRHRPDRPRLRPGLGPPARRARLDRRARRAQHRRRRARRRGHNRRRPAPGRARRRDRRRGRRRRTRRAAAPRRRPARRRPARGGDRPEPGLQRRRARARLVGRDAVPDALVPRAVGDPEPEDHRPRSRRRRPLRARAAPGMSLLLTDAYVVTMDGERTEHDGGWILVADGRIEAVGADERPEADETASLGGALVTPGLVNTHHHLYQTLTRARAQQASLVEWLRELYPVWAGIDGEAEYTAARTGLAELALSGCTTVFDHHYVFPRGRSGLVEAEVRAAQELGVRIVASRGSMDLGESDGGLPPDSLVEEIDHVLAETERLAAMQDEFVQIAVAPCSPFSVTKELMRESAELARRLGLRLHTHLAETSEEEDFSRERFGCTPVEYVEQLGWLAGDVWCAHCVHLSDEDVAKFGKQDV